MQLPESVTVEVGINPHSHVRDMHQRMRKLLRYVLMGGIEMILPMPNTSEGLLSAASVREYIRYAWESRPHGLDFIPCMMLTEQTTVEELEACAEDHILDVKVYPRNRTTNSENGVLHYAALLPAIKKCGELGIRVHVHPENPNLIYSNRDAEFAFLPLVELLLEETEAIIIWEHGTDARCIGLWKYFAEKYPGRFYVTLTAHHLATNEDDAFGDVRSVCKPPIKTEMDRLGLIGLVAENFPWVMLGADDAPHPTEKKHVHKDRCACGAYTAPYLMPLCAHALSFLFVTGEGINTFINFTSRNARKLYEARGASRELTLVRRPFLIPKAYSVDDWDVESFWAGRTIDWSLAA